ncbi:unnamed protein product [Cuscuta campestris]|uniref:Uncharacterized protein n=1 Tax=Cuscuta campestris TaxID=132261 RepID=A0A484M995_9ASTE|nr:unnamed protein product [Cuscuta campestris]
MKVIMILLEWPLYEYWHMLPSERPTLEKVLIKVLSLNVNGLRLMIFALSPFGILSKQCGYDEKWENAQTSYIS